MAKIQLSDENFQFEVFEPDAKPYGRAIGWLNYQKKKYHFKAYLLHSPEERGVEDWCVSWIEPNAPPLDKYQELVKPLTEMVVLKCRELELEKRINEFHQKDKLQIKIKKIEDQIKEGKKLITKIKKSKKKKWVFLVSSSIVLLLFWLRLWSKSKEKSS